MRISDWSSDVCSSDLCQHFFRLSCAATADCPQAPQVRSKLPPACIVRCIIWTENGRRCKFLAECLPGDDSGRADRGLRNMAAARAKWVRTNPRDWNPERSTTRSVRSEERREGRGWASKCRQRWAPSQSKKNETD